MKIVAKVAGSAVCVWYMGLVIVILAIDVAKMLGVADEGVYLLERGAFHAMAVSTMTVLIATISLVLSFLLFAIWKS